MKRIKYTKTELKVQKDALHRFDRFLPMLQLKKQQLQVEIQTITAEINTRVNAAERLRAEISGWVKLFAEPVPVDHLVRVQQLVTTHGNIAGVVIPILKELVFSRAEIDLFSTPPWLDDAQIALEKIIRLKVEKSLLEEQRRLIEIELQTTSQRVNLFEKVKIPECKENIRIIKIALGDQQTAAVARGKIAKRRTQVPEDRAMSGAGSFAGVEDAFPS
jgi:V/A-type H+-transporting ATPase subunit D